MNGEENEGRSTRSSNDKPPRKTTSFAQNILTPFRGRESRRSSATSAPPKKSRSCRRKSTLVTPEATLRESRGSQRATRARDPADSARESAKSSTLLKSSGTLYQSSRAFQLSGQKTSRRRKKGPKVAIDDSDDDEPELVDFLTSTRSMAAGMRSTVGGPALMDLLASGCSGTSDEIDPESGRLNEILDSLKQYEEAMSNVDLDHRGEKLINRDDMDFINFPSVACPHVPEFPHIYHNFSKVFAKPPPLSHERDFDKEMNEMAELILDEVNLDEKLLLLDINEDDETESGDSDRHIVSEPDDFASKEDGSLSSPHPTDHLTSSRSNFDPIREAARFSGQQGGSVSESQSSQQDDDKTDTTRTFSTDTEEKGLHSPVDSERVPPLDLKSNTPKHISQIDESAPAALHSVDTDKQEPPQSDSQSSDSVSESEPAKSTAGESQSEPPSETQEAPTEGDGVSRSESPEEGSLPAANDVTEPESQQSNDPGSLRIDEGTPTPKAVQDPAGSAAGDLAAQNEPPPAAQAVEVEPVALHVTDVGSADSRAIEAKTEVSTAVSPAVDGSAVTESAGNDAADLGATGSEGTVRPSIAAEDESEVPAASHKDTSTASKALTSELTGRASDGARNSDGSRQSDDASDFGDDKTPTAVPSVQKGVAEPSEAGTTGVVVRVPVFPDDVSDGGNRPSCYDTRRRSPSVDSADDEYHPELGVRSRSARRSLRESGRFGQLEPPLRKCSLDSFETVDNLARAAMPNFTLCSPRWAGSVLRGDVQANDLVSALGPLFETQAHVNGMKNYDVRQMYGISHLLAADCSQSPTNASSSSKISALKFALHAQMYGDSATTAWEAGNGPDPSAVLLRRHSNPAMTDTVKDLAGALLQTVGATKGESTAEIEKRMRRRVRTEKEAKEWENAQGKIEPWWTMNLLQSRGARSAGGWDAYSSSPSVVRPPTLRPGEMQARLDASAYHDEIERKFQAQLKAVRDKMRRQAAEKRRQISKADSLEAGFPSRGSPLWNRTCQSAAPQPAEASPVEVKPPVVSATPAQPEPEQEKVVKRDTPSEGGGDRLPKKTGTVPPPSGTKIAAVVEADPTLADSAPLPPKKVMKQRLESKPKFEAMPTSSEPPVTDFRHVLKKTGRLEALQRGKVEMKEDPGGGAKLDFQGVRPSEARKMFEKREREVAQKAPTDWFKTQVPKVTKNIS